jgi:hypothetical protein
MSVGIAVIRYEHLTNGREFAEWLSENVGCSEGDIKYIDSESFEEALKTTTKKFRNENEEQIADTRKALNDNNGEIDIWVSW